MNKLVASLVAAAALFTSPVFAADMMPVKARTAPAAPASPWDVAFGAALMSDYNFRGISQSDRGASVTAYSELRYNASDSLQFYIASQYWAVDLPTHPSCECDFFGGVRPTFGALAFDFGAIYYAYPRERQVFLTLIGSPTFVNTGAIWTKADTDFWEVYGKVTWDVVKDKFAVGAAVYYSPDWLNTGADGTFAVVNAKVTMPSFNMPLLGRMKEIGWFISGEVGHYWLGTSDAILGLVDYPDYTTWNVGVAFTSGVFTLDLRYFDTDLTKQECFAVTGDLRGLTGGTNPLGQSKWCNPTFIATAKFDLVASKDLK